MKHEHWHAHYATACAEEADGEYMPTIAITSNDERTYQRSGSRGDLIAFVPYEKIERGEAKARLIAAAPELLAALDGLCAYIVRDLENNAPEWRPRDIKEYVQARDAIAKAKGKQS